MYSGILGKWLDEYVPYIGLYAEGIRITVGLGQLGVPHGALSFGRLKGYYAIVPGGGTKYVQAQSDVS